MSANADEIGRLPVVVVGNGPVGMRVVADLFALDRKQPIVLYGEEEHLPYDRIKLSSWLAGEVELDAIEKPYRRPFGTSLDERFGVKVVSIDRDAKTVLDSQGKSTAYLNLILATGSTPHLPPVLGIERHGVYTLRDMRDALHLMARRVRSHHTVVIGGGLLGLEAARGMQPTNTSVTIIEHVDRLMANQLDERSGELLKGTIEGMGFDVVVGDGIKFIRGTSQVDAVVLHSGRVIECDTVVVATGIRPNITLAQNCGLSIGRGITVDNSMRTSDPYIFAIGECAEHDGEVYGLVAPGFEQAGVAASAIAGVDSHYRGSIVASRLKVIGTQVFSVGPVGYTAHPAAGKSLVYEDPDKGIYRKLLINRDKLQGAISLGDWPQSLRTQGAVSRHDRLYPWQRIRFRRTGNIWSDDAGNSVSSWPDPLLFANAPTSIVGAYRRRSARAHNQLKPSAWPAVQALSAAPANPCSQNSPATHPTNPSLVPVVSDPCHLDSSVHQQQPVRPSRSFLACPMQRPCNRLRFSAIHCRGTGTSCGVAVC